MSVIKQKNSGIYQIRFQIDGKKHQFTSGTKNKSKALEIERKKRQDIMDKRHLGKLDEITLYSALDLFELSKTGMKTFEDFKSKLRSIRRGFSDQPIHELTTRDVELFVVGRKKEKRAMQTIKHSIIQLRSMVEYVGKLGYKIPEITYPVLKVENSRIRSLSKEEEVRLFKELEPRNPKYYKQLTPKTDKTYLLDQRQDNVDLVTLLIDLGSRYSESAELKLDQVNLKDKTINLRRTKTNNESILMMSDRVFDVLKRRIETNPNGTWVFTDKTGLKPRRHSTIAIRNALKNAGIKDFKVHDFRHTFASRMVRSGMTLQECSLLLGHRNLNTTLRYAHLENQQVALKMKQLINDFNSDTDGEKMGRVMLQHGNGQLRAWVETFQSGKKQIYLPSGVAVGFYIPKTNTTHRMSGELIGRGDLLTSLI